MYSCHPQRGDIFGELCLSGLGARLETATAMKATTLKQIPCSQFFTRLSRDSLFEGFVRYLAVRIADQQQVIANLVTVDSEQRLGKTLLQLARTMGKKDPRSIRIELRISHEELSEMVGTTRPRVSLFMQRFHNLGLIETNRDRFPSSKKTSSPPTSPRSPVKKTHMLRCAQSPRSNVPAKYARSSIFRAPRL